MGFIPTIFSQAERLRMEHRPEEAIPLYHEALEYAEGDGKRDVYHMMGVAYRMAGDHVGALEWLRKAAELAVTSDISAHIARDLGEAHRRLGHLLEAGALFNYSGLMFGERFPEEEAATQGYAARLELQRGKIETALRYFDAANGKLKKGSNRHYELYNKLHYARALILNNEPAKAELVLDNAEVLIEMNPGVGFEKHHEKIHFMLEHLTDPDAVRDFSAT